MNEILHGGNMEQVIRRGDTVRRITGPWTAAVHKLLKAYEQARVRHVPAVHGVDDEGREILTFIPGEVLAWQKPEVLWDPAHLTAAAVLLRNLHDASLQLLDPQLVWRQPRREPAEVVCHNDFAPYNLIVSQGELAGVIDFDMASPGTRVWDLSYLGYRLAPYAEDAPNYDPGRWGEPDERLLTLVAAYGGGIRLSEVLATMVERLEALAEFTEQRYADTGRDEFRQHAAMYRRDALVLSRRR